MDESEVLKFDRQFELQRITKLSEAIRIGARLSPPGYQNTWVCGGTCAVAAAYEALFGRDDSDFTRWPRERVRKHFGISENKWLGLGISGLYASGMTREAIADKLEAMGY